MPKVLISVSERVYYRREVEMTDEEWRTWWAMYDSAEPMPSLELSKLWDKYIRTSRDWSDADDMQLEDLMELDE